METEGNLLQKMKNVFSDNEDKEKIAEEIIEKGWGRQSFFLELS